MQDISDIERASIDYPREEELVSSAQYTFRITAPLNSEKVEVCVDGAPWQLCRYAAGNWWHDWSGYQPGPHEVVARVLPFDSRNYILCTRRFSVAFGRKRPGGEREVAEYSVLTPNEPWTLARLTQLLSKEDVPLSGMTTVNVGGSAAIQFLAEKRQDLRRKLEDAGLSVAEKEVLRAEIHNSPDELNRLVRALAEREISVRSLLGTFDGGRIKLMLTVDRPELAASVLESFSQASPALLIS